jgi:hypothetical protein
MIPLVQMVAWEDELKNLTNSTTISQFKPVQKFIAGCIQVTCLIHYILFICIIGFNEIMKVLREITLKMWLLSLCSVCIVLAILNQVNPSFERFNDFTTKICKKMVFNTNGNGVPLSTLPHTGYLPPEIYYSCLCILCATILINIQHIVLICLVVKIKPKTTIISGDKNGFKPSSRPSTVQNQEISKNIAETKIIQIN